MDPSLPGKEVCRVRPPKVTEHQGCMKCLAVAPGGTLVTGGRDNAIICWDLRVPQPAVLNVVKYSHKPLAKRSAASLSGSGPTKASVTALDFIDDQVWPLNQFAPFAKKKGLICLERKLITPHRGEEIALCSVFLKNPQTYLPYIPELYRHQRCSVQCYDGRGSHREPLTTTDSKWSPLVSLRLTPQNQSKTPRN